MSPGHVFMRFTQICLKAWKTWALIALCLALVGPAYDLTFTEVRDDSLVVEWKAPVYNGVSAITGYFIEKSRKGSDTWSKVNESSVNHCYLKVLICECRQAHILRVSVLLFQYARHRNMKTCALLCGFIKCTVSMFTGQGSRDRRILCVPRTGRECQGHWHGFNPLWPCLCQGTAR